MDTQPLIGCWASLSQSDYRDVLPTITVPTLLIFGAESTFYTLETAHYVHDHIPGACAFTGSRSFATPLAARRFIEDIRAFVAKQAGY
ncbi:MAG: alpha/beta hydrolase [Candidatus Competibacteraceae bacterium]